MISKIILLSSLPNCLSITRIVLSPMIFICPLWTMIMCSISDFLDGFIARRYNQETKLGAILDIVADKIFLNAWYVYAYCILGLALQWYAIVLSRDLIIACGYLISRYNEYQISLHSLFIGKMYVAIHMIFGTFLILNPSMGTLYVYLTAFLAIVSLICYILDFVK